jgi:tRNA(His) 5'-end guanylyltransferase
MNRDAFEQRMRGMECFHTLRLLPGAWVVIRVDGRGFSRFTASRFDKPFDVTFHDFMVHTAQVLLDELQGYYAYTESDEISILCGPDWTLFDRKLEKVVSISAAIASAAFTRACGVSVHFDSRVWLGADTSSVADYFRWRQDDAIRCALHSWCYWTLRRAGKSVKEATAALRGATVTNKHALLSQHGINFNDLPTWQRCGTGVYWEVYTKEGYDPKRRQAVLAIRRRLKVDQELPMQEGYSHFVLQILQRSRVPARTRREQDYGHRNHAGGGQNPSPARR